MYFVKKNNNDVKNNIFEGFNSLFNDSARSLKTDVIENEDSYVLYVETPGLTKNDISIEFDDGTLVVSTNYKDKEEKNYLRREIYNVSSKRSFYLEGIDEDKVTARLNNGILTITVMKKQVIQKDNKRNISID